MLRVVLIFLPARAIIAASLFHNKMTSLRSCSSFIMPHFLSFFSLSQETIFVYKRFHKQHCWHPFPPPHPKTIFPSSLPLSLFLIKWYNESCFFNNILFLFVKV